MDERDDKILESAGWSVDCKSPFELSHEDGSFASGWAATIVLDYVKSLEPVYAVKDRWHTLMNGDKTPEVRSDESCFENDSEKFFLWVRQHGGSEDEIYEIRE